MLTKFFRRLKFNRIYKNNSWGSGESYSGNGSTLAQTQVLRIELEKFMIEHQIKSVVDIPCGDFNWMNEVNLNGISYYGFDVSSNLVRMLKKKFTKHNLTFNLADICEDNLPDADLVLVRDCFVHLSLEDTNKAMRNLLRTNFKYYLITTFTRDIDNSDILTGSNWRPINLSNPPFNFPKPYILINENCTEADSKFTDKSIGIWTRSSLLDTINLCNY